jgi:uncharacterized protein (DUF58 family)
MAALPKSARLETVAAFLQRLAPLGRRSMTKRGFGFLFVMIACVVAGAVLNRAAPMWLGAAGLLWFALEAAVFAFTARFVAPGVVVERTVNGRPVETRSATVGRPYPCRTVVRLSSTWGALPRVELRDRLPSRAMAAEVGAFAGSLVPGAPVEWLTPIVPLALGRLRWDGVRVDLADRQGFFAATLFVRQPVETSVLPPVVDLESAGLGIKRSNILPVQGLHRHRRAGSGGELLDLRDYRPGDPPRNVAWKLSAKRDRLVTKEYEAETPVRSTILLDASASMRVGPAGQAPFDRLALMGAALARRIVEARDPVGLTIFDEATTSVLQPAPGKRQLIRFYARLAASAAEPPKPVTCPSSPLVDLATKFADDVYPDRMDPSVNRRSSAPYWVSLLFHAGTLYFILFLTAVLATFVTMNAVGGRPAMWQVLGLLALPVGLAMGVWTVRRLLKLDTLHFRRQERGRRKKLAALVAVDEGLGPGALSWLEHDEAALSAAVQRFLARHRVAYSPPLFDPRGKYLLSDVNKSQRVAKLLARAVAHAKDDEFFVLMVDALSLLDGWEVFLKAVRTALARKHQVAVVFPWPDGLPPPNNAAWLAEGVAGVDLLRLDERAINRLVRLLDFKAYRAAYLKVHDELARLRVPVVCMAENDAIPQLLNRLEGLRRARRRP